MTSARRPVRSGYDAAWAASRLVSAGSLRDGVMVAGLAPCEIASVATTAMAGGEAGRTITVL